MIWDTLSPLYDVFETVYNGKCIRGIAEEIKRHVKPTDKVLECACGTGILTLPMAQICESVTATDCSEGMLNQASKKLEPYKNTKLQKADILNLPYDDNQFDVVVAANVIHLLDDPARALSEMRRVCEPEGRIIIPTFITQEDNGTKIAAKALSMAGVSFKRSFTIESYKEFFSTLKVHVNDYRIVEGRMPCAFAIIDNN